MTDYEYLKRMFGKEAIDHTGDPDWTCEWENVKILECDNILFVFTSEGTFKYFTRYY